MLLKGKEKADGNLEPWIGRDSTYTAKGTNYK